METNKANGILRTFQFIIIVITIAASGGGIFLKDLYRDSEFYKTAWLGNDLVTLVLVVPAFLVSWYYSVKKSVRGTLIHAGLLTYLIYNYAYYLFGAVFNSFFLFYVILFSTSIIALILVLTQLNKSEVLNSFKTDFPVKLISLFLLLIILPLGLFEIYQCVSFTWTQIAPDVPSLIFALDLSIVVPIGVAGAIYIWNRHFWGYIMSAILLVKGSVYGMVLCVSTTLISINVNKGNWDPLMPYYIFVLAGSVIVSMLFFSKMKTD